MNPADDPLPPHHTPRGYCNPGRSATHKSFADVMRWRWRVWRDGLPPPALVPTPRVPPDLPALAADRRPSATWIGHSTALLRAGGLTFLTDPIFSDRASPSPRFGPKRAVPPGIALSDLPDVDVVLISHGHYDHLDRASVEALARRSPATRFVAPLGYRPLLERWGVRDLTELDWWQTTSVGGVDVVLTPAQHWTARGIGDRDRALWGAFAVFAEDFAFYFSGDSGFGPHFAETAARLADRRRGDRLFDLALLAIGAYEPRWFMAEHHMNPEEAVAAHRELSAAASIAIHWGTFALTDEALDEPPAKLAAARAAAGLSEDAFRALAVGETWWPTR